MERKLDVEMAEFNPAKHGLEDSFRLTDYASLKGWGCKVPEKVLLKLLEGLKQNEATRENMSSQSTEPRIGINVKCLLWIYNYTRYCPWTYVDNSKNQIFRLFLGKIKFYLLVLVLVDDGMRSWWALISHIFDESVVSWFECLHSVCINNHLR